MGFDYFLCAFLKMADVSSRGMQMDFCCLVMGKKS